ncbi:MAG: glycosyltransferase family 2 protein [Lachnospiraceae bacterium]|nr:glycosyltransferase family 2 protein [Lachnospiraceae bacterium]MCI8749561.1 glycosyltransferase family 2 protein [Lachnospiraceae bacterium]
MSKCAIIILVYRDSESAIRLVESIKQYHIFEEIVIVDNCSPDNSYEKLKILKEEHIHIIQTTGNAGIAKGNNFGALYAKRVCPDIDYYLFSNPDVIVSRESICDMISFLDRSPEYAAVCPMELTKEKEYARDFAWKRPTYAELLLTVMPVIRRLYYRNKKNFLWFYDVQEAVKQEVFPAEVIISCFIMTRCSDFKEVGGFCEKTFLYHEEDIFAYRLYEKGRKLAVLMKHPIIHLGCSSMDKEYKNRESINKLLVDSGAIYMSECLRTPQIGIWLYKIIYRISLLEKALYRVFKRDH